MDLLHARAAGVGLAGAVSFAGCLLDFDGLTPAGTGGVAHTGGAGGEAHAGGSGGSSALPSCGKNGFCVDVPSELGTLYRVTPDKECANGETAFRAGLDKDAVQIAAPDAECTCACSPSEDPGCPNSLTISLYDATQCTGNVATRMLMGGQCLDVFSRKSAGFTNPGVVPNAPCASDGAPANRPPIELPNERFGCLEPVDPCEGTALCVPGDATWCVIGDGALECPAGLEERYAIVRDLPEELADTRDCACDCGQFTGACEGDVELFSDNECNTLVGSAVGGLCFSNPDNLPLRRARLTMNTVGSCDVTESLSGAVTVTPRIACCNQPI